jgi:hypothetical protein
MQHINKCSQGYEYTKADQMRQVTHTENAVAFITDPRTIPISTQESHTYNLFIYYRRNVVLVLYAHNIPGTARRC